MMTTEELADTNAFNLVFNAREGERQDFGMEILRDTAFDDTVTNDEYRDIGRAIDLAITRAAERDELENDE